ncbi:MAG: FAD-binding protein, partial [Chloroflexota bacterium]
MSQYEQIDADVLIIGGGSAGAMAAVHAKELNPHARVVIFEKGQIRYSGSIPRGMDALNIVAVPGIATPEDYVVATKAACEEVVDETTSYVMAQRSWDLLHKLESWGVYFPRDKQGNYEVLKVHSKGRFAVTMREPELKVILAERLANLGCTAFNRTMAVELLTEDGEVRGALGLNVRTGELLACRAKAVILSAGGIARFGLPDNGYLYGIFDCPANTGDTYALSYRAGAELTGLEYTTNAYIVKDVNAPLLYITLTRGGQLLNALGQTPHSDHPSTTMMMDEHRQDRAPLFIRMSHLPHEKIEEIEDILFSTERPVLQRFFEGRGVNFRTRDIELGLTEFFLCGGHGITGVAVDETAASTVPGLYAAGDAANVGRGHLTGAFVFGELAVESAYSQRANADLTSDVAGAVAAFTRKRQALQNNAGSVGVDEFEYKVRRGINNYVVPPKNEVKLNRALETMGYLRRDLAEHVHVKSVPELVKALEVENIITCAVLSTHASLERKESRWGFYHYRADYPTKQAYWDQHVAVCKG